MGHLPAFAPSTTGLLLTALASYPNAAGEMAVSFKGSCPRRFSLSIGGHPFSDKSRDADPETRLWKCGDSKMPLIIAIACLVPLASFSPATVICFSDHI